MQTRLERVALALFVAALCAISFHRQRLLSRSRLSGFPRRRSARSRLMLLTGYAGPDSRSVMPACSPPARSPPAFCSANSARRSGLRCRRQRPSARCSALIFGLPSLRLRGLYLAVSTLALYFVVVYLGGEYESKRGFSTGIMIDAPRSAAFALEQCRGSGTSCCWPRPRLTLLICVNLLRSRTGRAWRAIRAHETVAEALGIAIARYKLLAFVISSALAVGGRSAVRLLSRFRFGRGVLAVSIDPVRRDDHHRRHGIAAWRAARRLVRHAASPI